jgi:hypothetical protein
MLIFNFNLENPFSNKFKNLGCHYGKITKNKAWEIQHYYDSHSILLMELSYTIRESHAGLKLFVGIFGYTIHFQIYDTRHWDYEKNEWSSI